MTTFYIEVTPDLDQQRELDAGMTQLGWIIRNKTAPVRPYAGGLYVYEIECETAPPEIEGKLVEPYITRRADGSLTVETWRVL